MANIHDITRNAWMLKGPLAKRGYDWWWHSFTAEDAETGAEKPFYVEFFTCNPAHAKDEPVIVWNRPEAQKRGERPSYLMVNVGTWGDEKAQLHRFFAWKDVRISPVVPFSIDAADCFCSETETRGSIHITEAEAKAHPEWMCDAGSVKWDLKIQKDISFHVGYGASKLFRDINSFEMFWHAEGMKSYFEGEIEFNGRKYLVKPETCYGYADKNWGGDFTSPWVWLSSNNLVSKKTGKQLKNSCFEIGGGRPKIFFYALERKLLGQFFYEGKNYEFNFSKFWTGSQTKFDGWETDDEIHWHVEQTTFKAKMVTDIVCQKKDMLNINYEAPNGTKRHNRLWNGGNGVGTIKLYRRVGPKFVLIDEVEARNIGCEYGEYDK